MSEPIKSALRKPKWLNKKINLGECQKLHRLFKDLNLNTICRQALCPNISECFSAGVATFLILGKICTRNCKFCNVNNGTPIDVDLKEPERILAAVEKLGLKHVVITSVTRDDIPDGGAYVFAETIRGIHNFDKSIAVEVLVPDFQGNHHAIWKVLDAKPQIFAHNLETVPRLYPIVRSQAKYNSSLEVLAQSKKIASHIYTKSGIMVGLGERENEVFDLMEDLRKVNCDFLSIGQYLAPSTGHAQVESFIHPEVFTRYKQKADELGFLHTESAPYVRSSYMASQYL